MRTVINNDGIYLDDMSEASIEISLVHAGKEICKPYHAFSGTQETYVIHFILSGGGFYSVNGKTWNLSPGEMFLIYPDEPVVYCADKNNPWTYLWIGFQGLGANTVLKNCGFSKNNLVLPAPPYEEYASCIDELFSHDCIGFSNNLYRESALLKLFAILTGHHDQLTLKENPKQSAQSDNAYVNLAMDYINKMYMQDMGVSDIADSIGVSRAHLNHIFQKELNISLQKFLIDFRMHKAANLLVSTALSIKEIASQVGYRDQLVFSKAFKNKFEMSPKSYRAYNAETKTSTVMPD